MNMKIGYKVEVNATKKKLEEVYVIVLTPFGIAQIPVAEYILIFCDSVGEMLEVLHESAECFKETQEQCDFKIAV